MCLWRVIKKWSKPFCPRCTKEVCSTPLKEECGARVARLLRTKYSAGIYLVPASPPWIVDYWSSMLILNPPFKINPRQIGSTMSDTKKVAKESPSDRTEQCPEPHDLNSTDSTIGKSEYCSACLNCCASQQRCSRQVPW